MIAVPCLSFFLCLFVFQQKELLQILGLVKAGSLQKPGNPESQVIA